LQFERFGNSSDLQPFLFFDMRIWIFERERIKIDSIKQNVILFNNFCLGKFSSLDFLDDEIFESDYDVINEIRVFVFSFLF